MSASVLLVQNRMDADPELLESLRDEGYRVDLAKTAAEALLLASHQTFSVAISDDILECEDGSRLVERIQTTSPETTVISLINRIEEAARHQNPAVFSHLTRPLDPTRLKETLRMAVDVHERRRGRNAGLAELPFSVLVLEDSAGDRALIRTFLERASEWPHTLLECGTLADARQELAKQSFDLIISDLHLPDAQGLEAVYQLQRFAPSAAIVVLSGLDDDDLALRALQAGAEDFVSKDHIGAPSLYRALRFALERKRAERQAQQLALQDPLTNLINRSAFRSRLRYLLHRDRPDLGFGIVFIDIDHFRGVNDSLGHAAGERLLREIGERITAAVRSYDTVARLGGDEFAIIAEDPEANESYQCLAERVRAALSEPFVAAEKSFKLTASVGIAAYPRDGQSDEALLKAADTALYRAKSEGRDQVVVYSPEGAGKSHHDVLFQQSVRDAVDEEAFYLNYQPQVDIHSGALVGFEALIRWHPEGRKWPVPPPEFIPVLEDTGLILRVGHWVIRTAMKQLAEWRQRLHPNLRMAVNVSAHEVYRPGLVDRVRDLLTEMPELRGALELELTESVLMKDTDRAEAVLTELAALGPSIALDDFGTGYSSLAYLHRFPVHVMKLDRSFVSGLGESKDADQITRAVIGLGHNLGINLVAEGIETQEQLRTLRAWGCRFAQGYYLGRPEAEWATDDLATIKERV